MLILPIKRKWFNMIKNGEKKEEYREIKPYYKTRFYNEIKEVLDKETFEQQVTAVILYNNTVMLDVIFRNGYSKNSPQIKCKCIYKGRGQGKPEWGAEKRKRVLYFRNIGGAFVRKLKYYIFCIKWLWENRQWENTRQKFKTMEKEYKQKYKEDKQ